MNGSMVVDPHKKTDISQLLNPQNGHAAFAPQILPPLANVMPHPGQAAHPGASAYNGPFESDPMGNPRSASWGLGNSMGGASRRKDNGVSGPSQHYASPAENYPQSHAHRMIRPRPDQPDVFRQDWPSSQQQDVSNSGSAPPLTHTTYSNERTALPGEYHYHNNYNHVYQESSTSSTTSSTPYQKTERVSVRQAARNTALQHGSPGARYDSQYYEDTHAMYNSAYQQPQDQEFSAPLQSSKRPAPSHDEVPAPKAKKPRKQRLAPDGNPAPSKRGFNAKKRADAAQLTAQNAALVPTVTYGPNSKGKEKAGEVRLRIDPGQYDFGAAKMHPELQSARCMSNRYRSTDFPRCVSCTRRWAGDTCRFQGLRYFMKDENRNIVGISFVENQRADAPKMKFPTKWNVELTAEHIDRTKRTTAKALLPVLRKELEHVQMSMIIHRPRESEVRATCDTCMTSLFCSSWMCRMCGRESCADCFEQVKELTVDLTGASQEEVKALQKKREAHAHWNPFFLACTKRNEHQASEFSPVSRFCRKELKHAIEKMSALVEVEDDGAMNHEVDAGAGDIPDLIASNASSTTDDSSGAHTPPESGFQGLSDGAVADKKLHYGNDYQPVLSLGEVSLHLPPSSTAPYLYDATSRPDYIIPSHEILRYTNAELTEEVFRPIWAKGVPILVINVLEKFNLRWTPEYFIEKYAEQSCLIIECQTDKNKRITVGEFFAMFGDYRTRSECWKLKDWPPSSDFKTTFPELYDDFSQAVPIPSYVRRDGAMNIASHFPSNTVSPDLGPKMYNAMRSNQAPGSKGSTRLHMDMSDALNIMTYAAPAPDGSPGRAAWDLFNSEDSEKLRAFLRKKFKGQFQHDPIHSQQFYLDEALRRELWEEYQVKSYRVYQAPGEAVFIPAGCAHQVCNMSDIVKVAIDFVSPENIARCEKLTREFREQNQSHAWKEDVLQLRSMMWFAWLSCDQLQESRQQESGQLESGLQESRGEDLTERGS